MLADISPQSVKSLIVDLLRLLFYIVFLLFVQTSPAIVISKFKILSDLNILCYILDTSSILTRAFSWGAMPLPWIILNLHQLQFLRAQVVASFFRSSLIFWNAMFLGKNHCTKYVCVFMYVCSMTHSSLYQWLKGTLHLLVVDR